MQGLKPTNAKKKWAKKQGQNGSKALERPQLRLTPSRKKSQTLAARVRDWEEFFYVKKKNAKTWIILGFLGREKRKLQLGPSEITLQKKLQ